MKIKCKGMQVIHYFNCFKKPWWCYSAIKISSLINQPNLLTRILKPIFTNSNLFDKCIFWKQRIHMIINCNKFIYKLHSIQDMIKMDVKTEAIKNLLFYSPIILQLCTLDKISDFNKLYNKMFGFLSTKLFHWHCYTCFYTGPYTFLQKSFYK